MFRVVVKEYYKSSRTYQLGGPQDIIARSDFFIGLCFLQVE